MRTCMPSLPQYATRSELVEALRQCAWSLWFAETRAKNWTLQETLRRSVGPNTFRYFRGLSVSPSVTFRNWADRWFDQQRLAGLVEVTSEAEFDSLLHTITLSLRQEWKRKTGQLMDKGPATKLPGLVLKHRCASPVLDVRTADRILPFLHVPLDSYTLAAIRVAHAGIPRRAGMGWVQNWREYNRIQSTIRECAAEAGVPPIALDVLAWNLTHRPARKAATA